MMHEIVEVSWAKFIATIAEGPLPEEQALTTRLSVHGPVLVALTAHWARNYELQPNTIQLEVRSVETPFLSSTYEISPENHREIELRAEARSTVPSLVDLPDVPPSWRKPLVAVTPEEMLAWAHEYVRTITWTPSTYRWFRSDAVIPEGITVSTNGTPHEITRLYGKSADGHYRHIVDIPLSGRWGNETLAPTPMKIEQQLEPFPLQDGAVEFVKDVVAIQALLTKIAEIKQQVEVHLDIVARRRLLQRKFGAEVSLPETAGAVS